MTIRKHLFGYNVASLLIILTLTVLGAGCSTSTTYMTHPKTLEPGEMQGSYAVQGDLNTAIITETVDAARANQETIDEEYGGDVSEEQFREILDAAVAWALLRPSMSQEMSVRAGIVDGLDAGVRYTGTLLKGDVKGRLWQSEDEESALSLTVGGARQAGFLPSYLEYMSMSEFSRWDLDVSLMYGGQPLDFLRTFIGPRAIHSWIDAEPKLSQAVRDDIPEEFEDLEPSQYFHDENMFMLGGTGGLMIGSDPVWLVLETTVMHSNFKPTVLGDRRDMSGWVIAPTGGLLVEM